MSGYKIATISLIAVLILCFLWIGFGNQIVQSVNDLKNNNNDEVSVPMTVTHYDYTGAVVGDSYTVYCDSNGDVVSGEIVHPTVSDVATYDELPFWDWHRERVGRNINYYARYANDTYVYVNGEYEPTDASSEVSVLDDPLTLVLSQEPSSDLRLSPPTTITDYTAPTRVYVWLHGGLGDGTSLDIEYDVWLERTADGSIGSLVISDDIVWQLVLDSSNKITISNMQGSYDNLSVEILDITEIIANDTGTDVDIDGSIDISGGVDLS